MMEAEYVTLNIGVYKLGDSYQLELTHTVPGSTTQVAPKRGLAAFDVEELRAKELLADSYGQALSAQLFSDPGIKQRFREVELIAQNKGHFLRLSLCIDPSAMELQSLRWELVAHPERQTRLCTSEKLLFSRFMVSSDWRSVTLRARAELTALIAVSAPPAENLQQMKLAAVDFAGEVKRISAALGTAVKIRIIGGPGAPLTVDRLVEELRGNIDILYLACHGQFNAKTGRSALILQDDAGLGRRVPGEELSGRIGELQQGPRLVVLASCQSGGDGAQVDASGRSTPFSTFATQLAQQGVPAVLAMQGFISMTTVEKMMPVFFTELVRDGQIDRAMAAARSRVQDRDDSWMPALYTRLTAARIWYTPGFADVKKDQEVWRKLLPSVRKGKLVPILGPRLLEAIHGTSHQAAQRLAVTNKFPYAQHDWDDLPRVTEYMSTTSSRFNVVDECKRQLRSNLIDLHKHWLPPQELAVAEPKLERLLGLVGDQLRQQNPCDPYRILAELPASVYLTTNFDSLLERALAANKRQPQQVLTRWHYKNKTTARGAEGSLALIEPTGEHPVVYHAFGAFGASKDDFDLVLTEDDYFDYLIETSAAKLNPPEVESALVDNSLLFLGFRLTDWHFRVLFRLMMNLPGRERLKEYCHVAVQIDPDLQTMTDVDGAKEYLKQYFGLAANIDIYWGSAEDFLKALRNELAAEGNLAAGKPTVVVEAKKDEDDEWT